MDQGKAKQFRGVNGNVARMGSDSETLLVIKLPDPRVLRVISRSVFLALVFITFPCIGSYIRAMSGSEPSVAAGPSGFDHEQFDLLLRGLAEEGLLRKSDKALIVCNGARSASQGLNIKNFHADQMVMVIDSASERESSLFFDESFDFVYVSDLAMDARFVDRVVRTGGILAFPLGDEYANTLREKSNYKIVYIRRYSSTIVAMRNIDAKRGGEASVAKRRRLLQSPMTEADKAEVLNDLEEVLMEPPRQRRRLSKDSARYSRRIKFLPQLLGDDSLEGFRRRVFVNVGLPEQNRDVKQWFNQNYPKMRQEFEVYDLNVVPKEGGRGSVGAKKVSVSSSTTQNGLSDWLAKNVREEEYVVMKAEAEAVEEMVSNGTIHLVDELFLECNNQWWKVGNRKSKNKRAYWECLALYGRVKDEGVAVHQWWG